MPELKLGSKYECQNCGTKFYDLGKTDPVCPKCGTSPRESLDELPAASQAARRKRKVEVVRPPDDDEAEPIEAAEIDDEIAAPEGVEADLVDDEEEEDLDDEEV